MTFRAMFDLLVFLFNSHRIPECSGLEGTLGSSSPTPLPKQGHPEQAAQHRVQAGLEYLQRTRSSEL